MENPPEPQESPELALEPVIGADNSELFNAASETAAIADPASEDSVSFDLPEEKRPVMFYSRRHFLGLLGKAAAVGLMAHSLDVSYSDSYVYHETEPRVEFIDSNTPEDKEDTVILLDGGLGVPGASLARTITELKPYLEDRGRLAYLRRPDTGLTPDNFLKTADVMADRLSTEGIKYVVTLAHSAAGANLPRTLNAPVTIEPLLGRGISRPTYAEPAPDYWQREANLNIRDVLMMSSPLNYHYINGAFERFMAEVVGDVPNRLLRAGVHEKFFMNWINNNTKNRQNFDDIGDATTAAYRSARDDYAPTQWLTQFPVLRRMTDAEYRNAYGDHTTLGLFIPSDSRRDGVVLTQFLHQGFEQALRRPVELYTNDNIEHGNMADKPLEYGSMIIEYFRRHYPNPDEIARPKPIHTYLKRAA